MPRYFRYFPKITHNGKQVRDITKRVRFFEKFRNTPYVFLPYTITEEDTPENIAHLYYGDSKYVWAIYLANNIIDPYLDWPMSQRNLEEYVKHKYLYACVECAINATDIFDVTKAQFAILLDAYDKNVPFDSVSFYEVSKYSLMTDYIETNYGDTYLTSVLDNFRLVLTGNSHTLDYENEISEDEINTIIAYVENFSDYVFGDTIPQSLREAIVRVPDKRILQSEFNVLAWSKSTNPNVRNIIYYQNNDDAELKISFESYELKTTYSYLDPDFVAGDWTAVRAYDYEFDLNEDRRQIYVVDKRYIGQVEDELEEILK